MELHELENEMVCPLCAKVDTHASSVIGHVDVSEYTGQIVDNVSTHQAMHRSRMYNGDWYEKRYIVSLSFHHSVFNMRCTRFTKLQEANGPCRNT